MSYPNKFLRPHFCALAVIGSFALWSFSGCGGGGGGSSSPSVNATSTPVPTATPSSCTNATYTPNYAPSVKLLHWEAFPIRVYFKPDSNLSTTRQNLARSGFNEWVKKTNNQATYSVVTDASQAEVTVTFFAFNGGAGDTLGTTSYSYDSDNVIHSATVDLGITGDDDEDINTAAHEFGHTLGIGGHSPSSADLMYYTGNSNGCSCITASDLNTILTAYCGTFNHNISARKSAGVEPLKTLTIH